MGDEAQPVVLPTEDRGVERLAQTGGGLRHGIEDGLDVRGRAGDHAEDLGRGRLLLQRFREVPIAGLQLLEQAHVFDGNHGLISEGLEQPHLLIREEA